MITMMRPIQNRYELKEEFLQCRFSTLYHAQDLVSQAPLTVRMIHQSLPADNPELRRNVRLQMFREGRALSGLKHRNLPGLLDVIEDGDRIYLLLEDFRGRTMEQFLGEVEGFLDERILIRWLNQFVSVLSYLHHQFPPIIHRDLNPKSVIITPHGVLKLAEFGLAKIREPEDPGRTLFKSTGNPIFAAPEQLLGNPSQPANDIYSLGALLYYMAAKKYPRKSLERYNDPGSDEPLQAVNPQIPDYFAYFVEKMMKPDIDERFTDIYEVQEEILKRIPMGYSTSLSLPFMLNMVKAGGETGTEPESGAEGEKAAVEPPLPEVIPPIKMESPEPEEPEPEIKPKKKAFWDEFLSIPTWMLEKQMARSSPVMDRGTERQLKQYPFIDLSTMQLSRELGMLIPQGIAKSIQGVVIGKPSSREIMVAVKDPTHIYIYDHIYYATGNKLKPVLVRADPSMIDLAREYIYTNFPGTQTKTWLEWLEQKKYETDKLDVKTIDEELDIFKGEIKGPVIEAVDRIIKEAISIGASDIHMESYENDMVVRYRIDGVLHNIRSYSSKMAGAVVKRIKITAGMDISQDRITQGGRISVRVRDREFDLRVSIVPVPHGENIVMRLLNKGAFNYSLSDLGFDEISEERYRNLLSLPYGMILVSGPTGSGKSTTLYASLTEISRPDRKLLTVEDPIEYEMPGITQVQVNMAPAEAEKKVTFARALREFLRQDPDVIMVGEIRDEETAAISVQAALTGHLLLSTIHTNDSIGIITRLEDMGIESYLISSTLLGGIAQRLVRKVCDNCKEKMETPPGVRKKLEEEGIRKFNLYKGKGCLQCHFTGNRGRLALYEILTVSPELRPMIAGRSDSTEILKKAQSLGMRTLYQDGLHKVANGVISYDEVMRVTLA